MVLPSIQDTRQFETSFIEVEQVSLDGNPWYFQNESQKHLINKIKESGVVLSELCEGIYQGIATGKDQVFVVDNKIIKKWKLEDDLLYSFLKGKDISRYSINWSGKFILYPYDIDGNVIKENDLASQFPKTFDYLKDCRESLNGRGYFDKSSKNWYELWNQRNLKRFFRRKILTLDNASQNSFALDSENFLGTTTVYSLVLNDTKEENYFYILSLLNSKVLNFYHKNNTIPQANGFYRYQATFLKPLPIHYTFSPTFFQETNVSIIVEIAKQLDGLYKLKAAQPDNLADIDAQIANLDQQIDALVYKLYDLTEEEIALVEGSA